MATAQEIIRGFMNALDESRNNYILCVFYTTSQIGIAAADISTGDFLVSEVPDISKLYDEIVGYNPAELICNDALLMSSLDLADLRDRLSVQISAVGHSSFEESSKSTSGLPLCSLWA